MKKKYIITILVLSLLCNTIVFTCTISNGTTLESTSSIEEDIGIANSNYQNPKSITNLFNITAMTNIGPRVDKLNYLKTDLEEIGIGVDINAVDWTTFINELILGNPDFDMCYIGVTSPYIYDPDINSLYGENGHLNYQGYDQTLDYNASLGMGMNQWYIEEGPKIIPPMTIEKLNHYWDWQEYLMDNILPIIPGFTPYFHDASWANLKNYNMEDGIFQSWGKMFWDGSHPGQENTDKVVVRAETNWAGANPVNTSSSDDESNFIIDAIMDPMVWFDSDRTAYPHIINEWVHLNDTKVQLTVREGIRWQEDIDGNFTNEYVDAEDVYFSLYCYKNLGEHISDYTWIDKMEIIDENTIDLYIDGDPLTPENEVYGRYLAMLNRKLLPEHYLNQTQLGDGITPDAAHLSWSKFNDQAFGTGLFEIVNNTAGSETYLKVNPDCWWLNDSLTSDISLDWNNRFGDFSNMIEYLEVEAIQNDETVLEDFEAGVIDIVNLYGNHEKEDEYNLNSSLVVHSKITNMLNSYSFNLRETRGTPLQNRTVCPHNSNLTIGLAIRKAIAYALDKETINNELHDGKYHIDQHPIMKTYGRWCNPNIIKYDYNLQLAKEYMFYAGYETGLDSDQDGLTDIYEVEISLTDRFNDDCDGDGLDDGEEVAAGTDPLDSDTDNDTMPDKWEVDNLLNPLQNDTLEDPDEDELTNLEEYQYNTNPQNDDTDGDDYTDKEEIDAGTNPLDPNDYPATSTTGIPLIIGSAISITAIISSLLINKRRR